MPSRSRVLLACNDWQWLDFELTVEQETQRCPMQIVFSFFALR